MSDPFRDRPFPRGALIAAGALIGVSFLIAGGARLTGIGTTTSPTSSSVESRSIRFEDRRNGSVGVYDARSNRVIVELEPGTNGFVRGVLRGFARDRRSRGIGAAPPFRLTRWADGRLSLRDMATGREIDLDPFGPTNAGAFAKMLIAARAVQPTGGKRSSLGAARTNTHNNWN